MKRRDFLVWAGGALVAAPHRGFAQQARMPRIGVLLFAGPEPFTRFFREGLSDLGYIEGRNIQIEIRAAQSDASNLTKFAAELAALKVDIIVASETPAVQAAKLAAPETPIVMAAAGDPVGTGLIASLARPGGNITGLSAQAAELAGKGLELMRELLPQLRRAAVLALARNPLTKPFTEQALLAAHALGVEVEAITVKGVEEFRNAFEQMQRRRIEAVIVQPSLPHRPAAELALELRLPTVSITRAYAEAGGLMSYAASLMERYRGAASYVDKILKGSKPAELPVGQPTKFELVVNMTTAKALGLKVPSTLIDRADDLIE